MLHPNDNIKLTEALKLKMTLNPGAYILVLDDPTHDQRVGRLVQVHLNHVNQKALILFDYGLRSVDHSFCYVLIETFTSKMSLDENVDLAAIEKKDIKNLFR